MMGDRESLGEESDGKELEVKEEPVEELYDSEIETCGHPIALHTLPLGHFFEVGRSSVIQTLAYGNAANSDLYMRDPYESTGHPFEKVTLMTAEKPKPTKKARKERGKKITNEANEFIEVCKARRNKMDDFSAFGDYIARRIRNLRDGRLQTIAQHKISNILFEIEMQTYKH